MGLYLDYIKQANESLGPIVSKYISKRHGEFLGQYYKFLESLPTKEKDSLEELFLQINKRINAPIGMLEDLLFLTAISSKEDAYSEDLEHILAGESSISSMEDVHSILEELDKHEKKVSMRILIHLRNKLSSMGIEPTKSSIEVIIKMMDFRAESGI